MRLERPFVVGLDDSRGRLERLVHIAVLLFHDTFAHRRLANVIVQRGLFREWLRIGRPFHLQHLGRTDRVPFLVGDDTQETLVPNDLGAGDFLD